MEIHVLYSTMQVMVFQTKRIKVLTCFQLTAMVLI